MCFCPGISQCRVYCNFDVDSDHYPVIATLNLKIKSIYNSYQGSYHQSWPTFPVSVYYILFSNVCLLCYGLVSEIDILIDWLIDYRNHDTSDFVIFLRPNSYVLSVMVYDAVMARPMVDWNYYFLTADHNGKTNKLQIAHFAHSGYSDSFSLSPLVTAGKP